MVWGDGIGEIDVGAEIVLLRCGHVSMAKPSNLHCKAWYSHGFANAAGATPGPTRPQSQQNQALSATHQQDLS